MATVKNSIKFGFDLELAFIKLLTMTNITSFDLSPFTINLLMEFAKRK